MTPQLQYQLPPTVPQMHYKMVENYDAVQVTTKRHRTQVTVSPQARHFQTKARKLSTERSRQCRQRQKHYVENLEQSVLSLRQEVQELRRTLAQRRTVSTESCLKAVRAYYHALRHEEVQTPAVGRKRRLAQSQTASDCIYDVMEPDVLVHDFQGTLSGASTVVNRWTPITSSSPVDIHIKSLQVKETEIAPLIVANGTLRVCMTKQIINSMFPSAALDDERLVGQHISFPMRESFYFNTRGRVQRCSLELDTIAALLPVVGNLKDVMKLVTQPSENQILKSVLPPPTLHLENSTPCTPAAQLTVPSPLTQSPAVTPTRIDPRLSIRFLLNC